VHSGGPFFIFLNDRSVREKTFDNQAANHRKSLSRLKAIHMEKQLVKIHYCAPRVVRE